MVDINYELRKMWVGALKEAGLTVYYQQVPDDKADATYTILDSISSNPKGTMNSQDTDATVQLTVRSYSTKYNDGLSVSETANMIFATVVPNQQFSLSTTAFQVLSTRLVSSVEMPYTIMNTRNYIDRVLTFSHKIYFN